MDQPNPATNPTALLVIDVQASFTQRPYFDARELPAFLSAQNLLISLARQHGIALVRIYHVENSGAFSMASGLVKPLPGLIDFDAAHTLYKPNHSALAGTELEPWLREQGISRLIISGIRSEQCCETTTRAASDAGFTVDYVTEATLTFPMTHANGRRYSSAEIKERCELVLADRFATICNVAEAIDRARTDARAA